MRRRVISLVIAALALAACSGPPAPEDPGVCFRVDSVAGKSANTVLARGVENLETCALLLEGVNLQGHTAPTGAYQGYFIFANDDSVSSSGDRASYGYPVFMPGQRDTIDAGLRKLMKENHGAAPKASDLDIGRQQ